MCYAWLPEGLCQIPFVMPSISFLKFVFVEIKLQYSIDLTIVQFYV